MCDQGPPLPSCAKENPTLCKYAMYFFIGKVTDKRHLSKWTKKIWVLWHKIYIVWLKNDQLWSSLQESKSINKDLTCCLNKPFFVYFRVNHYHISSLSYNFIKILITHNMSATCFFFIYFLLWFVVYFKILTRVLFL